jgi:hypothetical protein
VTDPHWTEAYRFGDRVEVRRDRDSAWFEAVVTGVQFGILRVAVNVGAFGEVWDVHSSMNIHPATG